jgi:hypothetical protein
VVKFSTIYLREAQQQSDGQNSVHIFFGTGV